VSIDPTHSSAPPLRVQPQERRPSPRWAASAAPASATAKAASVEVAVYSTVIGDSTHSASDQRPPSSPSSSRASPATGSTPRQPITTVNSAAPSSPGHTRAPSAYSTIAPAGCPLAWLGRDASRWGNSRRNEGMSPT
jgi:hypothetical protein